MHLILCSEILYIPNQVSLENPPELFFSFIFVNHGLCRSFCSTKLLSGELELQLHYVYCLVYENLVALKIGLDKLVPNIPSKSLQFTTLIFEGIPSGTSYSSFLTKLRMLRSLFRWRKRSQRN